MNNAQRNPHTHTQRRYFYRHTFLLLHSSHDTLIGRFRFLEPSASTSSSSLPLQSSPSSFWSSTLLWLWLLGEVPLVDTAQLRGVELIVTRLKLQRERRVLLDRDFVLFRIISPRTEANCGELGQGPSESTPVCLFSSSNTMARLFELSAHRPCVALVDASQTTQVRSGRYR